MRTTIVLDDDVAERTKKAAARLGRSFKDIVNEALRTWLELQKRPARGVVYRTEPHDMGLRPGTNLDNIQELLAELEGEDSP